MMIGNINPDDKFYADMAAIEKGEKTHEEHQTEVELEHFEQTGVLSTYAIGGKTWAQMGWPEP